MTTQPDDQARQAAQAGVTALRSGDGTAAAILFERAIAAGMDSADIHVALAQAKRLTGDTGARRAALNAALQKSPGNVRALLYLAELFVESGDVSAAEPLIKQALPQKASAPQTAEMQQLFAMAEGVLAKTAAPDDRTPDALSAFEDLSLGAHQDDELFVQSLGISTGTSRFFPSQPSKYFYPGLPNRQFFPRESFDWSAALEAMTPAIQSELQGVTADAGAAFSPYVERTGREAPGANILLMDDPDWSAFYLMKRGQRQEANIARCPQTWAAIEAIGDAANPPPAPSVLFSRLAPNTQIPAHHGMLNTRLICHLPLVLPGDCGFRVGNDTREWKMGEMFVFDDSIEHEAWNNSDTDRYVLIFEIWRPEFTARQRALVSRLFELQGSG